MSQEIIDHVQAQFDSTSKEQIMQMINFDPEIDPFLDEAIWDTQLSQPQGQQQQAQKQQQIHPPILAVENHIEDYNSDSLSVYDDDPLDTCLCQWNPNRISTTQQIHSIWTYQRPSDNWKPQELHWWTPIVNSKYSLFCGAIVLIAFTVTMTMECRSDVTESVIFHPVNKIHTSISSWIITSAKNFEPYEIMLYNVKEYAKEIKNYLISQILIFHQKDPRYTYLFNMILDDIKWN